MKRRELAAEARMVARAAEHNIRWIWENPDRIDRSKREDMLAYLYKMRRFAKEEMKNARRAGRTHRTRRSQTTSLFASIIAHLRWTR